jgi:GNAT superfamily N-acetyltransferase
MSVGIRLATAGDLESVADLHNRSWRNSYRGVVPDAIIDARTLATTTAMWRENVAAYPENLWIAERAPGGLIGFCCAGPVRDIGRSNPFEFEIYALHVVPEAHRSGIGTALLTHQFQRMSASGFKSAIVWTMAGNGQARRFYERNGGTVVKTGVWEQGGHRVPDVAYGWPAPGAVLAPRP